MRSITITHLPERLYQELLESAQHHRRELNQELIACLQLALTSQRQKRESQAATTALKPPGAQPMLPRKLLEAVINEAESR